MSRCHCPKCSKPETKPCKKLIIKNRCHNPCPGPSGPTGSGPPINCNGPTGSSAPIMINFYILSLDSFLGPTAGGNIVVISGNGLSFTQKINFGSVTITSFTIINDNKLSFIVPAMTTSSNVKISVSSSNFTSNQLCYYYVPQPSITQLIPNSGPLSGGNQLTLLGTNLSFTQSINFGSTSVTNFQVINDGVISFFAPSSNIAEIVFVSVISPGGTSNALS
jgi:hypothetical protein